MNARAHQQQKEPSHQPGVRVPPLDRPGLDPGDQLDEGRLPVARDHPGFAFEHGMKPPGDEVEPVFNASDHALDDQALARSAEQARGPSDSVGVGQVRRDAIAVRRHWALERHREPERLGLGHAGLLADGHRAWCDGQAVRAQNRAPDGLVRPGQQRERGDRGRRVHDEQAREAADAHESNRKGAEERPKRRPPPAQGLGMKPAERRAVGPLVDLGEAKRFEIV